MQAVIEIDGKLNSGINGCLLTNCSIASGETAASQNYIQNFRKNRKIEVKGIDGNTVEGLEIHASLASRRDGSLFIVADGIKDDGTADDGKFRLLRKVPGSILNNPFRDGRQFAKKHDRLNFSYDFAKISLFNDMDCILVCAFGTLIAFSEEDFKVEVIPTEPGEKDAEGISNPPLPGGSINGICAFGNRMVATFDNSDYYFWSGVARPDFKFTDDKGQDTYAGMAASEYSNDMTRAVRRTGSRLAVFTNSTIEIKDLSQDPQMPFQGYLYQNNHDIGALTDTLRSIDGVLYFVGQEGNGNRHIYSLADGVPKKLTNENQSRLLSGKFRSSGTMQESGQTFYLAYGTRGIGLNIFNGSLFMLDSELEFIDYIGSLRVCKSGFFAAEPGSDEYAHGKARLPRYDFGAAANIRKISFVGEFLESKPAVASLTAERGFYQQTQAHGRGFDFFLLGLQKLNDLEFSVNANFRLTKIEIDYQLLKNASFYGAG